MDCVGVFRESESACVCRASMGDFVVGSRALLPHGRGRVALVDVSAAQSAGATSARSGARGEAVQFLSAPKQVVPLHRLGSVHDATAIVTGVAIREGVTTIRITHRASKGVDRVGLGDLFQRMVLEEIQSRRAAGKKDTVVARLSNQGVGIVLLPKHAEPRRQAGHQQAGAEIICVGEGGRQIELGFGGR